MSEEEEEERGQTDTPNGQVYEKLQGVFACLFELCQLKPHGVTLKPVSPPVGFKKGGRCKRTGWILINSKSENSKRGRSET